MNDKQLEILGHKVKDFYIKEQVNHRTYQVARIMIVIFMAISLSLFSTFL